MNNIDMRPFENYSWLRHSAKCQVVQPGWKYSVDSATLPLEKLAAAWAGVQQFMRDENFRNAQGFSYMLERETLEEAMKNTPSQMIGVRFDGGESVIYTIGSMSRNDNPFRNIRIYPADIRDTAVQILALLASGVASRVEMFRCIPDDLSEMQTSIIHDLFARLAGVFRNAGFAVNLHAVVKKQIREGIQDFGPEFPTRHIVKLNRRSSSTSSSPTDWNPDLMWINVSFNKVADCVMQNKDYNFYCTSVEDGIEAIYSIPALELKRYLDDYCDTMNGEKWSFYIDFKEGKLCASINGAYPHPLNVVLKSQF